MKKQDAEKLVNECFTKPYDETQFRGVVQQLFNDYESLNENAATGNYIPESFRDHIVSFKRLAKFIDPENREIDVLAVKLKTKGQLENARTLQRNFIARYLNGSRGGQLKDAALVAFYTDQSNDWRFSLIKMDYVLDADQKKVKKELTPARRYSFLVGQNEKTHTARKQLLPVLVSETETTLSELESAFNIETVTKEFFNQYKTLYLRLKEALDKHIEKDSVVQNEFDLKDVKTTDFAKRLLGQIVFLYFLQKKGWLGVAKGQNWGTGPKDFLQYLYEQKNTYQNFFNDILEPLFYEALATERADHFYQRFNCKIPFLNGGLFEPIRGYDWVNTDILLDNDIFKDIFEVFDLYNFTVREDEPLDKEVAVDPEMLGKVFENLIPENERKGSGTYYTPREIVHYMCQESLINYLETKMNGKSISRGDLEELVHEGDSAIEHNRTAESKILEKGSYTKDYKPKLPESIRNNAKLLDDALAHIKICDPAIGSGAFPVGMMNEIVRVRCALTPFINETDRTLYDFKRHAIQESIYGVDIESSAVDIAKLRLWLSLVVDEDDFGTIKPLPNLEYKIRVGNSLLRVERDLLNHHLFEGLEQHKSQYFDETSPSKKSSLKTKIDDLIHQLTGNSEIFDFEIYFSEVFRENGGFDVVIGNPPYGYRQIFDDKAKKYFKTHYISANGSYEQYFLFFEASTKLLTSDATHAFIVPVTWLTIPSAKSLRKYLLTNFTISTICWFDEMAFESANVNTLISLLKRDSKNRDGKDTYISIFNQISQFPSVPKTTKFIPHLQFIQNDFSIDIFQSALEKSLIDKLKKRTIPLEQICTPCSGYNPYEVGAGTSLEGGLQTKETVNTRPYHSKEKNGEHWKPEIGGRDLDRFFYTFKNNRWIKYGPWLAASRDPENFRGSRILVREITGGHDKRIIAAYCDVELYYSRDVIPIKINSSQINPFYILGWINSKLISWYHQKCNPKAQKGLFPKILVSDIKKLPFLNLINTQNVLEVDNIVSLVKRIIDIKSKASIENTAELEEQIDRLVYQLYDLTDEEIAIVEGKDR